MKGYSSTHVFTPEAEDLRARATQLVAELPEGLRCHEVARLVCFYLRAYPTSDDQEPPDVILVDGHCDVVEHSWLVLPAGLDSGKACILDPYAVGRLPPVQLVDPWLRPFAYRPGPERTDIDEPCIRRALVAIEHTHGRPLHEWNPRAVTSWMFEPHDALRFLAAEVEYAERTLRRQRIHLAQIGSSGFGAPGIRDPDAPCESFDPGEPLGTCETDGHYLCDECSMRATCDGGCGRRPSQCECPDCEVCGRKSHEGTCLNVRGDDIWFEPALPRRKFHALRDGTTKTWCEKDVAALAVVSRDATSGFLDWKKVTCEECVAKTYRFFPGRPS